MTAAPFGPQFADQFDADPGETWTAHVEDNPVGRFIAASSLTVRMGKDAPDPLGQADASTCSFDLVGDPTERVYYPLAWWINYYVGVWTDAPKSPATSVHHVLGGSWTPTTAWTGAELSGKQFVFATEAPVAAGVIGFLPVTAVVTAAARPSRPGYPPVAVPGRARMLTRWWTANPWNAGGTLVAECGGPWRDFPRYGPNTAEISLPGAAVPPGARWLQWFIQYETGVVGSSAGSFTLTVDNGYDLSLILDYGDAPDTFETGDRIVIRRNNVPVWTGTLTDDVRDFAPSRTSVKVNGAGPRRTLNNLPYEPDAWLEDGTAYFPSNADIRMPSTLKRAVDVLAPWITKFGIPVYQAGTDDPKFRLGNVAFAKGSPLHDTTDLLDGCCNVTFGNAWETRDGGLRVLGNAYYRDPPAADRIVIDASEIDVPVRVQRVDTTINAWKNPYWIIFDPTFPADSSGVSAEDMPPLGAPFYRTVAGVSFDPDPAGPVWYDDAPHSGGASDIWEHLQLVVSRSLDQIDSWTVARERVDPATWERLIVAPLGSPIRLTNLPPRLFRDGRTTFDGFLFGWQLQGTQRITMTLVDARQIA